MVRNRARTTKKGSYANGVLLVAVDSVRSARMPIAKAVRLYNIPRTTITDHVKECRGVKSKTFGRPTTLNYSYELKIADSLRTMEKYGYGLSRYEVLQHVGKYVNTNNLKTSFKNGVPGEDW